eukprot:snap_masked-scaffold_20-processed-gene-4.23-mRNA-1 protein AED:1.00 eAED:1.00 QI:0/-1/0/0/-1/1/1/0/80
MKGIKQDKELDKHQINRMRKHLCTKSTSAALATDEGLQRNCNNDLNTELRNYVPCYYHQEKTVLIHYDNSAMQEYILDNV